MEEERVLCDNFIFIIIAQEVKEIGLEKTLEAALYILV
jgi:hypothetical protein